MEELNMSEMSLLTHLKNNYSDISSLTAYEILEESVRYESELDATSNYNFLDIDEQKIFSYIQEKKQDEKQDQVNICRCRRC